VPSSARDPVTPNDPGVESAEAFSCDDCDQPFKSAQGLAGHRRLAHSTSTRTELEAKASQVAEREAAAKNREDEAARRTEAARRAESDLTRRERALRAAEAIPESDRLRGVADRETARLPEVPSGAILRVDGIDYRISEDGLTHVYWPKGEKVEVEEGERFRFAGRAYSIRGGSLRPVPASAILARLLGEED
jgi:hypothetical protein